MNRRNTLLMLLLAGTLLADLAAWVASTTYGGAPEWQGILLYSLALSQVALVAIWTDTGTGRLVVRWATLCFLLPLMGHVIREGRGPAAWAAYTLVLALVAAMILALLFAARLLRYALARRRNHVGKPPQFAIWHILAITTLAAVLLQLNRSSGLLDDKPLQLFATFGMLALPPLWVLRAMMVERRLLRWLLALVVVGVVTPAFALSALPWMPVGPRFEWLIIGEAILVALSLAVLRTAGLRLREGRVVFVDPAGARTQIPIELAASETPTSEVLA